MNICGMSYLVWWPKLLVIVIHVHVVTIKLWIKGERRNKHGMQEEIWKKKMKLGTKDEVWRGKALYGWLKCETNDFVTLVKPRGGMAAWVITVRQRAGN